MITKLQRTQRYNVATVICYAQKQFSYNTIATHLPHRQSTRVDLEDKLNYTTQFHYKLSNIQKVQY